MMSDPLSRQFTLFSLASCLILSVWLYVPIQFEESLNCVQIIRLLLIHSYRANVPSYCPGITLQGSLVASGPAGAKHPLCLNYSISFADWGDDTVTPQAAQGG
jgi:hypothetical protein